METKEDTICDQLGSCSSGGAFPLRRRHQGHPRIQGRHGKVGNVRVFYFRFQLGPNGAILTSLNLFSARFDLVLEQLACLSTPSSSEPKNSDPSNEEKGSLEEINEKQHQCPSLAIVDTPGQIEVFTWSASGTIITESIAASHPTILVYVVDTPRCATNPATFMSNMLYACSLLYKTRLPLLVVLNKTDEQSDAPIREWMQDCEAFQDALRHPSNVEQSSDSFMNSMLHSMSLVLEEFYSALHVCGSRP